LKRGGSIRNDEAFDIIADAQGNTVITCMLGGNIAFADFDGIQVDIVSQSAHCFIARYDPNGLIACAERMWGGSDDVGLGLALAIDSTFFLTGTTWGSTPWHNWNYVSCCLDPNLFIAKLNDTFNDFTTSVDERAPVHFSVFPNPSLDRINVSGPDGITRFTITDAMGRVVHAGTGYAAVDVSAWANGLYRLMLCSDAHGIRAPAAERGRRAPRTPPTPAHVLSSAHCSSRWAFRSLAPPPDRLPFPIFVHDHHPPHAP